MKICWDTLTGVRLTWNGHFRKNSVIYVEIDSCAVCGEPFLAVKCRPTDICSKFCRRGRKWSKAQKDSMSKTMKKKYADPKNHPWYGRKHSEETKQKLSGPKSMAHRAKLVEVAKKRKASDTTKRKMSEMFSGSGNPNYKGGVYERNLALYDTYAFQISFCEEVRRNEQDLNIMEVRCAYCGNWYVPRLNDIKNRVSALNRFAGEQRLYCSDNCKKSCPIFHKKKWPEGFKPATSREVQPELRQLVFERDEYTCQKCGKTVDEIQIHCHHIDPASQNPIESADTDNCITLCKNCHKEIHNQGGCKYHELKCLEEKNYGNTIRD